MAGVAHARIRVLIVDDHMMVADALSRALGDEPDMEIVGVAMSVSEVRALRVRADVVLMDYRLPDGTGADATRYLKQRSPRTRVIMVTGLTDDDHLLDSVHAGADGYLTKNRTLADIVAAVRAAHAGETLLPPPVIARIAHLVATTDALAGSRPARAALTPSETRVLSLLVRGSGSDQICASLGISRNTLRSHIDRILAKLGARSRVQAVTISLADPSLRATLLDSPPTRDVPSPGRLPES